MERMFKAIIGSGDDKEVLTKAAKAMDAINNETEYEGVILSEVLNTEEIQEFKNYIGSLIVPYIRNEIDHRIHLGQVNGIEEDAFQNLALIIYKKFPMFNNSKTKDYGETYDFSTFVKIYAKDAIRKARAQERGYKSRLDRKRRKISKARTKAAQMMDIREEDVVAEEIYEYMPLVTANPISLKEIKRSLNEYRVEYSFDDSNCTKNRGMTDDILISEERIESDFETFIHNMRPMQKYIFLQSYGFCSNRHENMKSNAIGFDPVLVRIGKEDENGRAHIRRDDQEYLEDRYIRKEKERLTIRMRKLVERMEYTETEIRANLIPLLYELQEEMRIRYDL